jgi:streptomycin 6-kinase
MELAARLAERWSLTIHDVDAAGSYVAYATRSDGSDAVLKIAMPHMEGEHEIQGLLLWNGDPSVHVLEHDVAMSAMLLERCMPGTPLRSLAEPEQDEILAALLKRMWRMPPDPHPFRPLAAMLEHWSAEAIADRARWRDAALVEEGLRLFRELPLTTSRAALLATDLHAGNVLRSAREPWLAIDPKPFLGDPAYDATQHLFNCWDRVKRDPRRMTRRMADLLEVDQERVWLWTFARAAVESRGLSSI